MKANYIIGILLILLIASGCQQGEVFGQGKDAEREQAEENQTEMEQAGEGEESEQEDSEGEIEKDSEQETDKEINEESEEETVVKEEAIKEEAIKEPRYEMNEVWSFEPIDDADEKVVLMTFDDAPDKHGVEMAETLHKLEVPAIFFVNGHFIESEEGQEELKQIHEMGFAIGNHTYDHPNLKEITEEEQEEQIVKLNDKIEEIIGERPKFFRAPHGANTDFVKNLVKEEGMLLMNWSFGYDFQADYMEKEALAEIMVETELLGNGSNLLMHDREWTHAALPDIVSGIREKGFGFIDPEEILIPE